MVVKHIVGWKTYFQILLVLKTPVLNLCFPMLVILVQSISQNIKIKDKDIVCFIPCVGLVQMSSGEYLSLHRWEIGMYFFSYKHKLNVYKIFYWTH